MQLHSVPSRGTSFRVLLPAGEDGRLPVAKDVTHDDLRGSGTLLVVDDEVLIRAFTKSALEPYGYCVLQAGDGAEAVRLVGERRDEIALVLLDVAMPGMDGLQTLEKIREVHPDTSVNGSCSCDSWGRWVPRQIDRRTPPRRRLGRQCRDAKEVVNETPLPDYIARATN